MVMSVAEIKAAIAKLTDDERAEVQAFLEEFESTELSPAWRAEIQRRVDDYRSGKTKGVLLQDVLDELERRS